MSSTGQPGLPVAKKSKFAQYNLELQEVLIGTPGTGAKSSEQIEKILIQLRQRQIADEQ